MKAHKRRKLGLLENVKEGFTEMILGMSMRMSVSHREYLYTGVFLEER